MSEFDLSFDEPTIELCGHPITLLMDGFFEFNKYKQITRIVQDLGNNKYQEVCPIKSQPLYDALVKHFNECAGHQHRMNEVLDEQYGYPAAHRSTAWMYQLP
jgi:hypothetical protein